MIQTEQTLQQQNNISNNINGNIYLIAYTVGARINQ